MDVLISQIAGLGILLSHPADGLFLCLARHQCAHCRDVKVEEEKYRKAMGYTGEIERMERYAFYERAKQAYAVVVSGETAKYGNIILKKGVTPICD